MTRNWPMQSPPGEEHDHPHHRSLWLGHFLVNGIDFWSEGKSFGKAVHTGFDEIKSGKEFGIIKSKDKWVGPDGKVVCTDDRALRIYHRPNSERLFDFEAIIHASNGDLVFGDTKEGMMALEADVEAPENSPTFKKYEHVLNDHHLLEFIVDYLRMMSSGNINALEMQDLMDEELETHHAETSLAAGAIQKMADGLPAFGIVAAVMGVVHTMGSVGAAPAILGEMIAGALVGTFLGILLSYGFFGPLADLLTAKGQAEAKPFQCVKSVLLASMNGYAPAIAVEFGRKVLFTADSPTFKELDDAVRATKQPKSA